MTDTRATAISKPASGANRRVAMALVVLTAAMIGLTFASVPLYRLFCQVTGYGGTTQRVDAPSAAMSDQIVAVRFDATTSSELNWSFRPVETRIELKVGENRLAFYKAVNRSDHAVTGTATFNVTPEVAGSYFNKVACFCFNEQTLGPGQEVDMPVSFFIDPAILSDPETRGISEITLSYTFFEVSKPKQSAAPAPVKGAATPSFEKGNTPG
jgi:cytochrome c oxidase assembly protein subunit 11